MKLSIVIPVLNEAQALPKLLGHLQPLAHQGVELVVADGGSEDDSARIAEDLGCRVVQAPLGRAVQMNAGAAAAAGDVLLFLHADTLLPDTALPRIQHALASPGTAWGRFDVQIVGTHPMLKVIAFCMNRRSRLTGVATGDQAIFVRRGLFEQIGGFPEQPLMEDIALSQRLLAYSRPACLRPPIATSGRRWETRGVWATMFLMWRLRLAYWRGASPEALARSYHR